MPVDLEERTDYYGDGPVPVAAPGMKPDMVPGKRAGPLVLVDTEIKRSEEEIVDGRPVPVRFPLPVSPS